VRIFLRHKPCGAALLSKIRYHRRSSTEEICIVSTGNGEQVSQSWALPSLVKEACAGSLLPRGQFTGLYVLHVIIFDRDSNQRHTFYL
jgi:hypothetical protein